ncbi:DUF6766 family protein [Ensifer sp. ENS01]|uniref:DUF6766 family protein n=1 Tax=Ensifer TaxID=106591 RepID=UPI0032B2136C
MLCFSDRSPRQLSVLIRVLQNWQSAFLSTAVLVTLSIFPRVRGSSFCPPQWGIRTPWRWLPGRIRQRRARALQLARDRRAGTL